MWRYEGIEYGGIEGVPPQPLAPHKGRPGDFRNKISFNKFVSSKSIITILPQHEYFLLQQVTLLLQQELFLLQEEKFLLQQGYSGCSRNYSCSRIIPAAAGLFLLQQGYFCCSRDIPAAARLNQRKLTNNNWQFQKSYEQNFPAIIESLDLAIKLAQRKKVSGIVTLPILKKTLTINGTHYPGHTEYLGKKSNKKPLMIMLNKTLKVATLTTHIPISQVPNKITKSNLEKTIRVYM